MKIIKRRKRSKRRTICNTKLINEARKFLLYTGYTICMKYLWTSFVLPGEFTSKKGLKFFLFIFIRNFTYSRELIH